MRIVTFLLLAVIGAGCAPAISTLKPATVVPHKHVQGAAGYGLSIPVGGVARSVSAAKDAVDRHENGEEMSEKDQETVIKTALGMTLNPPSLGQEYQLVYGIAPGFEIDARYALSAWRLGGRYQFITPGQTGSLFAGTVGLGVSRYVFSFGVPKFLKPVADVEDFERWDVDMPVLFGASHDIFHVWAGPKVIGSYAKASVDVCTRLDTNNGDCLARTQAGLNGYAVYVAGQGGVALGYKHAWIALELTTAVVNVDVGGRVRDDQNGINEKRRYNFNDFIVYPVLGIILRY